jgi:hypothetical protein
MVGVHSAPSGGRKKDDVREEFLASYTCTDHPHTNIRWSYQQILSILAMFLLLSATTSPWNRVLLEKCLSWLRKCLSFMETESSFLCPQQPAAGPYPELVNPYHIFHILFSFLMFSPQIHTRPRPFGALRNMLAHRLTPGIEDNPFSAGRENLSHIYTTTPHVCRPSQSPATRGQATSEGGGGVKQGSEEFF